MHLLPVVAVLPHSGRSDMAGRMTNSAGGKCGVGAIPQPFSVMKKEKGQDRSIPMAGYARFEWWTALRIFRLSTTKRQS
jgi:hypothetical protein